MLLLGFGRYFTIRPRFDGVPANVDWVPAIALAGVILVASAVPIPGGGGPSLLPLGLGLSAVFHVVGYAALAAALARPLGRASTDVECASTDVERASPGLLAAAVLATGFGLGVEIVQLAIPWRTFAVVDAGLNAVGAATTALLLRLRA